MRDGTGSSSALYCPRQPAPRIYVNRNLMAKGVYGWYTDSCRVGDEEATLVLLGPDYDGGHKAWVRWPDGSDDIVPGSRVTR